MRRYRVKKEGDRFYPEWKSFWTFGDWKEFYYTRNCDFEDNVYVRNFATEGEAWEFIKRKKGERKFNPYDIEGGD
jgi:hypothetical protein